MKIAIKNLQGKSQGELEVKFPLVEDGKGTQAVHDTVVAYRAAQRSGTACTKNVGEVAGTNKKPWRQKGTGRARVGDGNSPHWRGGGVAWGPRPRDYSKKMNKKEARLAFRRSLALSDQVTWPIAELTVRYLRSAEYPGSLTVELAPIHVGRTSFTLGYGIFDREGCVAVALNRSVCVDRATGGKVPIQETVVARLRELSRVG